MCGVRVETIPQKYSLYYNYFNNIIDVKDEPQSCGGDSGGPLFVKSDGKVIVIALVTGGSHALSREVSLDLVLSSVAKCHRSMQPCASQLKFV